MPTDYSNSDTKEYLITDTDDIYMVSNYSRLAFSEVLELDCYTFRKLLINAYITNLRGSKQGQEYLETCWILTQTGCEIDKLKKRFGKEG